MHLRKIVTMATLSGLLFSACNKEGNRLESTDPRVIKYEITGNFTGKLLVVYLDNVSGNTQVNNVTLPWSKEITYPGNVIGIGISGQSTDYGLPGQTATLKIYSGGTVVKTGPATADNIGQLLLPTFTYSF